MASVDLQEKENFIRLVRLLVDKGTEALRNTLDTIHTPVSLPVVLNANRPSLSKLKPLVINDSLWDLLFPPSGNPPDSKTFDMILLTILLRNICGLHPPATGWNKMPPSTNNSLEANITRIKLFKNQVYGHFPTAMVDEKTFEDLWQAISRALVSLNVPQQEIDDLKICPLRPEEEKYLRLLKIIKQEDQGNTEKDNQELWKWKERSQVHREKFKKLLEFTKQHPSEVKVINGVRICCLPDFLIGKGADGTRVYIGLGKDGSERAVKRLPKDVCTLVAEQENDVLTRFNTTNSNNVVKYWFLDKNSDEYNVFLIFDLYEETLNSYVDRESADDLATIAPEIIRQILKGLADIHRGPKPILHRDLKPSNILRDVNGKWLLANFGNSLVMGADETIPESELRGTRHWRAVETCPSKDTSDGGPVRYKKESDIQVAGMVAYYIVTKGEHPFGNSVDRERNLIEGNPIGLRELKDKALKDLLTWMLSHRPEDRPMAEDALKHPYFQSEHEQFEMLTNMGNQPDIKTGDINSNIVRLLNSVPTDWRTLMNSDVLKYLSIDFSNDKPRTFKYGSSWTECLRLIRNVSQHWRDPPRPKPQPEAFYLVGDPQEYFLKVFPNLPVLLHKIVRLCDGKERPQIQKCSKKEDKKEPWKWQESSTVHREKFENLREFGKQHPSEVKVINGVRVCCLPDFVIGKGADGTRVYVGLGKDGIERAVKRLPRDTCTDVAEQEMNVLTKRNTINANNVVRYWFLDESSDKENLFLILDLCEETLESYVGHESADDLATVAPEIIQQILKGLADLHRGPNPILHRDLKPSNILRDVNGKWLLADFGISRVMKTDETTYKSGQRGTKCWRAVETYPSKDTSDDGKVRYRKQSDIQVAGMVAYYIVTKGEHPFGEERDLLNNLLDGKPVGLEKLKDPALKDLLTWMLSHDPKDRPFAEEAFKHPYLQLQKQQFELLCNMGNQPEIKNGDVSSIVVQQLNSDSTDWRTLMNADVLKYLCNGFSNGKPKTFKYASTWTECLRLIRNVNQHWEDQPRPKPQLEPFYLIGDPREYFLKVFPHLPVTVHRIVRSCDWKKRPELQKYFSRGSMHF